MEPLKRNQKVSERKSTFALFDNSSFNWSVASDIFRNHNYQGTINGEFTKFFDECPGKRRRPWSFLYLFRTMRQEWDISFSRIYVLIMLDALISPTTYHMMTWAILDRTSAHLSLNAVVSYMYIFTPVLSEENGLFFFVRTWDFLWTKNQKLLTYFRPILPWVRTKRVFVQK